MISYELRKKSGKKIDKEVLWPCLANITVIWIGLAI
jgi:hypothetical protein